MFHGVVKRKALTVVGLRFCNLSSHQQSVSHEAMPNHDRDCRLLLLGEHAELLRKLAHHIAVKRYKVDDRDTVKGREPQ